MNDIKIRKSAVYLAIGLLLPLIIAAFMLLSVKSPKTVETASAKTLEEKFALLSNGRTNLCAGSQYINSMNNNNMLQGACCSAMNFHRYVEQVEGLKKYSHISKIPSDPYDIPVSMAREFLDYQKNIILTEEQQAVYDEAMKLSHEGGPCCCKCWRWYAFEGLGKYLITEYNFNAEQVAEVWDLEDGCGGSGHADHEGESMRETFEPQA